MVDSERSIADLKAYLDTKDPDVLTKASELFHYGEQSRTISRLTGVELYDPITRQHVLDITIRRTGLSETPTSATETGGRNFFNTLTSLAQDVSSLIRIQTQQINDEDQDGNIDRGLVALEAQKARISAKLVFDQSFVQREPGVYSSSIKH